MSKKQCMEAAVAADAKLLKAAGAAQGPSSTADHPFEGKAYVQVCVCVCFFCRVSSVKAVEYDIYLEVSSTAVEKPSLRTRCLCRFVRMFLLVFFP